MRSNQFTIVAAQAARQHSVVSLADLRRLGVSAAVQHRWIQRGLLTRLGRRSFAVAGSTPSFHRALAGGLADLGPGAVVAGRAAARLHGLDGFDDALPSFAQPRSAQGRSTIFPVVALREPLRPSDVTTVDGLRVLRAERLILDGPRFDFSRRELENAIDSAIRLRLVSEQRLRQRFSDLRTQPINWSTRLRHALPDSGGESRLERMFLALCRRHHLPVPELQRTLRDDGRVIARVDFITNGSIVIEVAGQGTHSTRTQRQRDAQRHTELTLAGWTVLTFTYEDIRDRPAWVAARLQQAIQLAA
jgi:very-short-patch-repair endonuclease